MEFRILGPVEVRDDGRVVRLGGGKQRAVLALLLLNANRVVASERMIELLWGERPPATAATALHGHISSLRKALGPDVIATRPPGYLLETGIGELDLERFERLWAEGRDALERGDPGAAAERLRAALELWRGEALSDIGFEPFVQPRPLGSKACAWTRCRTASTRTSPRGAERSWLASSNASSPPSRCASASGPS